MFLYLLKHKSLQIYYNKKENFLLNNIKIQKCCALLDSSYEITMFPVVSVLTTELKSAARIDPMIRDKILICPQSSKRKSVIKYV